MTLPFNRSAGRGGLADAGLEINCPEPSNERHSSILPIHSTKKNHQLGYISQPLLAIPPRGPKNTGKN